MNATAPTVSAALRRGGLNPVSTRDREGLHVKRTVTEGQVRLFADLDNESQAANLIQDAADVLRAAGYTVRVTSEHVALVTR